MKFNSLIRAVISHLGDNVEKMERRNTPRITYEEKDETYSITETALILKNYSDESTDAEPICFRLRMSQVEDADGSHTAQSRLKEMLEQDDKVTACKDLAEAFEKSGVWEGLLPAAQQIEKVIQDGHNCASVEEDNEILCAAVTSLPVACVVLLAKCEKQVVLLMITE